ncbi:MAG: type II toxin-antitoxin system VapC family toxin [Planctomycetes bacterium]|nr:type II toxin-antitoxin system VapC family toxin [Planctomycetota bacterium]
MTGRLGAAEAFLFDTSALAKRFVQESGSERVVEICHGAAPETLWISQLAPLEMRSLLRLASDTGRITQEQAVRLRNDFGRVMRRGFQVWEFVPRDWSRAGEYIDRHALRPGDALQLAAAISLHESLAPKRTAFVCSDRNLLRAANAEGMPTVDPVSG